MVLELKTAFETEVTAIYLALDQYAMFEYWVQLFDRKENDISLLVTGLSEVDSKLYVHLCGDLCYERIRTRVVVKVHDLLGRKYLDTRSIIQPVFISAEV